MYKVGHSSAVPRPTLVYNDEKTLNQYGTESSEQSKNHLNAQIPALSKRSHFRTSEPKRRFNIEAVSVLAKVTKNFNCTDDGRPDQTIKHYRPKTEIPADFVPFDIEGYLTERFLKDVNLDPNIVNSFVSKNISQ
ncbi:unnamed protein product [Thelazia callipaeda]|uniref:INCENP_ARK-bind domain-containing protein n=1 Tax=Thelazia callipaeda TaxID=103827 RepID=A0A0N5CJM9_THECL|nr:unnamed protein product [Thelazia callipaeda]